VVDNKIVFAEALRSKASSMIVCHNHPSGNMVPSESDIALTRKIAEACKLLDMTLLDHLIVGHNKYYSLKDEGDF
jgi:DNA repair protein RadC